MGNETTETTSASTAGGCPFTGAGGAELPTYPFEQPSALEAPPEWAQLRQQCPVAPVRLVTGEEALLLTRYDDVKTLLADSRFSRAPLDSDAPDERAPDAAEASAEEEGSGVNVFASAPDDLVVGEGHLRWRRMVNRSFTVKRVMKMQPRITEIAHELIDAMVEEGAPTDLRTALGFPLPVYVICELLGVPAADREKFAHWSDHFLNLTRYTEEEMAASGREFWAYMVEHVHAKREHPGDDLISELVEVADAEDGRLTENELVFTAQALLIAGHETTANMIGKMIAMLLSQRRRWEQLVADPSLVRSAVEETLRFDANLGFGMPRYVTEQVEIAGTVVEPGTTVVSSMSAANRDEQMFEHAEEMDLTRSPNPHITFGAGPHSCLGQSLARIELQSVLSVLLERLPSLELDVPPKELRRVEGLLVGGLQEVPVRW